MGFIPNVGILNSFFMGDSVLLEPVADVLASVMNESVYVVSQFPDLYRAHPHIIGVRGHEDDVPKDLRVIDMEEALMLWGGKNKALYEHAGIMHGPVRAPRLYLDAAEEADVARLKKFFSFPCIGLVLGSRHGVKDWPYMRRLAIELVKRNYTVFVFGTEMDWLDEKILQMRVHRIIGKSQREMMQAIRVMDIMIGPDTGPMQVAASLRTKTVVVTLPMFTDLYEHYADCKIITCNGGSLNLRSISVARVLSALEEQIADGDPRVRLGHSRMLFVRIRGIGDVIMTLPAIATIRKLNPSAHLTYVTSPACAKMLECTDLLDNVIAIDYRHAPYGLPPLPRDLDYEDYDVVHNLINRVEWASRSAVMPRPDLFGLALGLNTIDYATNWKGQLPDSWRSRASELLEKNGCKERDRVIALQVTSAGQSRLWQRERWTEFVGKCRHRGYKVVLLSDRRMKGCSGAINLTAKCSIDEYIGILAQSTLSVGPDSSHVHICGWLNEPALGLFGSVDPALRVAHYCSVSTLTGDRQRHCGSDLIGTTFCNDWQYNSCEGDKHCPTCMWTLTANRVMKTVDKLIANMGGTKSG